MNEEEIIARIKKIGLMGVSSLTDEQLKEAYPDIDLEAMAHYEIGGNMFPLRRLIFKDFDWVLKIK